MKNFKKLTILIVSVLAFLLMLSTAGIASSVTYSGFHMWNFQASGADGTEVDFNLFSGNVSVSATNGESTSQNSKLGFYNYNQTSNGYASAESFMNSLSGIDIGANADVNIPMTTNSLFEADANASTIVNESVFSYYFEDTGIRETTFTFSFDYQSILTGFASEFGLFDSSLGVDIRLTNYDTNESISLFSLNDSISGANTNISQDNGIQHFEKELTIMMADISFYKLDISINANAYAATEGMSESPAAPEPSAILLLGSGLIAAFIGIRRKKS